MNPTNLYSGGGRVGPLYSTDDYMEMNAMKGHSIAHFYSDELFPSPPINFEKLIQQSVDHLAKVFDLPKEVLQRDPMAHSTRRHSTPEILKALDAVVARAGRRHRSHTTSTNMEDSSGFRCIQGELMLELGYGGQMLPATYHGVADLLSGNNGYGYRSVEDQRLGQALMRLQHGNDRQEPWGDLLRTAHLVLAA